MHDDIETLIRLNQDITIAENEGDLGRLGAFIAPLLAFQRRDGSIVGRDDFLQNPKSGHRELRVESIQVYGRRAIVACVVSDAGKATHNLQLFVKDQEDWKLLGWANMPI